MQALSSEKPLTRRSQVQGNLLPNLPLWTPTLLYISSLDITYSERERRLSARRGSLPIKSEDILMLYVPIHLSTCHPRWCVSGWLKNSLLRSSINLLCGAISSINHRLQGLTTTEEISLEKDNRRFAEGGQPLNKCIKISLLQTNPQHWPPNVHCPSFSWGEPRRHRTPRQSFLFSYLW